MLEIVSASNEKIKDIIKLKQKKYRDETKLILLEGYKIFEEVLKANLKIVYVLTDKMNLEKYDLSKYKDKTILVSKQICEKLSSQTTSTNFFCVVERSNTKTIDGNFIILDNIQDPQNLGAIIRTSVATNILNIYCLNCVDEFNDKTIRASMGNVFKVNVKHINLEELKEVCAKNFVFVADMNGENLFDIEKPNHKFGIIMGNEGNGVSKEVKNLSSKTISIPMKNEVESLNVAVSFAVIAYFLTN